MEILIPLGKRRNCSLKVDKLMIGVIKLEPKNQATALGHVPSVNHEKKSMSRFVDIFGQFVAETLSGAILEIEKGNVAIKADPDFIAELDR